MFDHEMSTIETPVRNATTGPKPVAEDSPEALSRELANYAGMREQQRQLNALRNGARQQPKPGLATK